MIRVDRQSSYEDAVQSALQVWTRGGLVAFPTETVYGVGAHAVHIGALARLREVKSRPADRAFTVHLGSRTQATEFVGEATGLALRLMRKAWPGPLTLILGAKKDLLTAGGSAPLPDAAASAVIHGNTVGLRCPDDPVATALLQAAPEPVVAASANLKGNRPPLTAEDVMRDLDGQVELLIDAGRTRYSKPSTIVRVEGDTYTIVREGVYDAAAIERLATLRLLFVCTGNTCRSPMAAAVARKLLAERLHCDYSRLAERGVVVMSAGTGGGHGGASPNAVKVMAERGLDISDHVSRALAVEHIQQADHIYAMTHVHRDRILDMLPTCAERVVLLLGDEDVRDPVGGSESDYEHCAQLIEKGIQARLQEVML
ncbi:MAG: L-threonylcarbamoyladenylate synthase [Phycisphaerae bacterium]